MKNYTTIPAGYRITVETWENDLDNCNTKTISGLDFFTVKAYVALCKHFSQNSDPANLYGDNVSDDTLELFEEYARKFFTKYSKLLNEFDDFDATNNYFSDCLIDLLYNIGICGSSDFFTRVVDRYKVEYIAESIYIEDVTEQFKDYQ